MNPIVGIGELLWDIYPDGRRVAGGAPFNFAFHCHQLGHPAAIVSRVGDDDLGRELRERVRELGLSDEYIQTDREHPTGTVRVTLDASGVPSYRIIRHVSWDHIEWSGQLDELARASSAVCFGTLGQRSVDSRPTIQRFLSRALSAVKIFDVNLRPTTNTSRIFDLSLSRADWVKVNEGELGIVARRARPRSLPRPSGVQLSEGLPGIVSGLRKLPSGSLEEVAGVLYRNLGHEHKLVVVTRGENGALVFGGSDRALPIHEPGVPAQVIDTVGAGDAFTAAMVCLHLEGRPLRECARFANHYAARVCEHQGATPRIDRAEVERAAGLRP
jgi:fructokinase